jgi:hypothetical protein
MTPAPNDHLAPATVAAAAFTAFFGPEFAEQLAVYSIIFVAWTGGAMWGLVFMPRDPPWTGWAVRAAFLASSLAVVLLTTVALAAGLAGMAAAMIPGVTRNDLKDYLAPVAFVIPAIGHHWRSIGAAALAALRARISHLGERPSGPPPGGTP